MKKQVYSVEELQELMSNSKMSIAEAFKQGTLCLIDYSGVKKFKSIRRAIRRGHVSIYGEVYPHRPFKNLSPCTNKSNRLKRGYHAQLTGGKYISA